MADLSIRDFERRARGTGNSFEARVAAHRAETLAQSETMDTSNEIQVWREAAESRANQELVEAETRHRVAENALAIVEQSQAEAHRDHERKMGLQRLANEHEIAKIETVDVNKSINLESAAQSQRHCEAVGLQKGWLKGLVVGTPIGWAIGFGSGLAIGFLF